MRIRVRYSKLGRVRFVSHRDGARLWERALRRVGLPVASTQGFTPRPKMSFGLALPTGAESVAEYLDLELSVDTIGDPEATAGELSDALPAGLDAQVLAECPRGTASLQEAVTSTTWELWGEGVDANAIDLANRRLLDSPEVLVERERKGRTSIDDVRPLIVDLGRSGDRMVAELATVGRALRPAELASAAFPGIDALGVRVLRTHQWINHDGERREVLSLPTVVNAPRQVSCA